jgi:hypothetical protein
MKLLNEPYFIYASSSITSSGFGTVFASASDDQIYMRNDIGELYPLTESKGYINIVQITQSANAAWTKPGGLAYAHIICVGGGGGGGSGRQGAANSTRGGGGGGGGASIASIWFAASALTNGTYTASIALIANGAPSGSNAGVISNGGVGGNNVFTQLQSGSAIIVSAPGGQGGGAGTTAPGGAGGISFNNPYIIGQSPFALTGQTGGTGGTTANSSSAAFNGARSCGGGGGGGGITAANAIQAGGSGSATYKYGQLIQTGSPGGAASGVGGNNGINYLIDGLALISFSSSLTSSFGVGTGGHAGGSGNTAGTIAGGVGGNGGDFGAGGGGGGASTVGATAGRGGNGAPGCIFIIEYY